MATTANIVEDADGPLGESRLSRAASAGLFGQTYCCLFRRRNVCARD